MSRALSRSLAVVALLAVVSAALVVVSPSLARMGHRDHPHHPGQPAWLWESHVYGGTTAPAATSEAKPAAKPHATRNRRPYKPPVDRWSQP